jgi:hypothetical protein
VDNVVTYVGKSTGTPQTPDKVEKRIGSEALREEREEKSQVGYVQAALDGLSDNDSNGTIPRTEGDKDVEAESITVLLAWYYTRKKLNPDGESYGESSSSADSCRQLLQEMAEVHGPQRFATNDEALVAVRKDARALFWLENDDNRQDTVIAGIRGRGFEQYELVYVFFQENKTDILENRAVQMALVQANTGFLSDIGKAKGLVSENGAVEEGW